MKIAWLVNTELPEASRILNNPENPFGGWLHQVADHLSMQSDTTLSIFYPMHHLKHLKVFKGESITYIAFPLSRSSDLKSLLSSYLNDFSFDLFHIHGTEYDYHSIFKDILENQQIKYVVSIQGIMKDIATFYSFGLPKKVVYNQTFRDFIKKDSIDIKQKRMFALSLKEEAIFKSSKDVIGRTSYDKSFVKTLNPNTNYHHVNETLRKIFYDHTWNRLNTKKHAIFLAQGSYPIKGLHLILEELYIAKMEYPDVHLYVAGENVFKNDLKSILKRSSYAKYVLSIINRYDLSSNVTFLGILDEKSMLDVYLKCECYVLSSVVENSSNSLGEAMLLGMPIIASHVGGTSDFITSNEEGLLFEIDEKYDLLSKISYAFSRPDLMDAMGEKAKIKALKIFNLEKNVLTLKSIYQDIIKRK